MLLTLFSFSCTENNEISKTIPNVQAENRTIYCGCHFIALDPCCARISCDVDTYYGIGVDAGIDWCQYNGGTLVGGAPGIDVCSPCGGPVVIRFWTDDDRCWDFFAINSDPNIEGFCEYDKCCE